MRLGYWKMGSDPVNWLKTVTVNRAQLPASFHSAEVMHLNKPTDEVYLWSTPGGFNYGEGRGAGNASVDAWEGWWVG